MADKINVSPTPIQHNRYDVAIELTQLHKEMFGLDSPADLEKTFAKYYYLSADVYTNPRNYQHLLSDELVKK